MENNENLLVIKNLKVSTETFEKKKGSKIILQGLNLLVSPGEIHIIMGPNGSGKSTLSKILSGHPLYTPLHGSIRFRDSKLIDCLAEARARMGIFLGFQYPIEIAGVTNQDFLWLSYRSRFLKKSTSGLMNERFSKLILSYTNLLKMNQSFLPRPLNQGFSGGEKKKNEVLQLCLLKSELGILDEIDSGLDVDALKVLTKTILAQYVENSLTNIFLLQTKSLIFITHYRRLLDYVSPDKVQVMKEGKIISHGSYQLAKSLDRKGYDWLGHLGSNLNVQLHLNKVKNLILKQ